MTAIGGEATEDQFRLQTGTAAAAILATTAICILSAGRVISYGSVAGGWVFTWYVIQPPSNAILFGLGFGLLLAAFLYWTVGKAGQGEGWWLALVWLLVGTVAQLLLHGLYYQGIGDIENTIANDAYVTSRAHSNNEFLKLYPTLDQAKGGHVARNPPGRVVLYGWLRAFSDDPHKLAVIILIFSNMCGLALYYCVLKLYHNAGTALTALVYYLFIPSKIYFAPLLNIMGWAPIAVAWVVLVKVLTDENNVRTWGSIFGLCIFSGLMFDVTGLLSGGLLLVTAITFYKPALILRLARWASVALVLSMVLLYVAYRINLPGMILSFAAFNRRYNTDIGHRPYLPWVTGNLWEFFLGLGTPVFVLCCPASYSLWQSYRERRASVSALILAVAIVTLMLFDLMGVVRGEMMRLWIPIMVLPCIVAADYSVECGRLVCAATLFALVLQISATISMYRFVG